MSLDLNKMANALKRALEKETPESLERFFGKSLPEGWISLSERLPMMYAIDIAQGYSEFKVKDIVGNEYTTRVSDHNIWYHEFALPNKITHWHND